ncbi:MAG TPA: hypothetical protein VI685_26800 [Candidatus Angelobacter sp.]
MNDDQASASVAQVLGQLLMLPFAAFVYGMEVLIKTMQSIQQVSNQSMEVMAGPRSQLTGLPEARAAPGVPVEPEPITHIDSNDAIRGKNETTDKKEEKLLSTDGNSTNGLDKDLHDDMLKLVRYKVLFVRREYEVAFPEKEDLVPDNMDGSAFTAWKIAEFIQDVEKHHVRAPQKWIDKKYPREFHNGDYLDGIPHEDKKYLRVYYEVLERYPREKFKYEEQQIKVLEDIRDTLQKPSSAPPPPPPPPPASAAAASGQPETTGGKKGK